MKRTLVWTGTGEWRAELAEVELVADGLRAVGTQLGIDPEPYRADYRLDALDSFRTRRLEVEVARGGRRSRLELVRDGGAGGGWSWRIDADGEPAAASTEADAEPLGDAVDCDLALSPLTNLMPIRRAGLGANGGELDLVCAWVSLPELTVTPYPQRYEHVRRTDGGATVRFVDRGPAQGFVAELELDADGFVIEYPGLARRVRRPGG